MYVLFVVIICIIHVFPPPCCILMLSFDDEIKIHICYVTFMEFYLYSYPYLCFTFLFLAVLCKANSFQLNFCVFTVSYPRRLPSSYLLLWEPEILLRYTLNHVFQDPVTCWIQHVHRLCMQLNMHIKPSRMDSVTLPL